MASQRIRIKLKAYDHNLIDQSSQKIVETAKREAEAETRRIEQANRDKVADMAIMMAEKILAREVGKEDNKKIIDECLKEWE